MEVEKQRKLLELDGQRELLNSEMAEQRAKLGRLEGANQLLQQDDMMRHKAEKQQTRKKKNEVNSQEQIEKLKNEYQQVSQQLTSTYGEERKRQL